MRRTGKPKQAHLRRAHKRTLRDGTTIWVRETLIGREKMIKFMKVDASGRPGPIRDIAQEDILKCPHYILMEQHYRDDGSCRCNDSTHFEMAEWGYMWNGSLWVSMPTEDEDGRKPAPSKLWQPGNNTEGD